MYSTCIQATGSCWFSGSITSKVAGKGVFQVMFSPLSTTERYTSPEVADVVVVVCSQLKLLRAGVKQFKLFLAFLLCWQVWGVQAQAAFDEGAFRAMPVSQRYRFIHDAGLEDLDSAAFLSLYKPLFSIAGEKKDPLAGWVLRYYYFQQRRNLKLTPEQTIELLSELTASAKQQGFKMEELVARHYLVFEQYDKKKIPHEALYTAILQEFVQMQELGFEKFSDYDLARILKHDGMFLFDMEDFDKALQYLQAAEKFVEPTEEGRQTYVLVLNHLQTIYQQQKQYEKGIEYAQKILRFVRTLQPSNAEVMRFCRQWQGLASVDIASMLIGQGKLAESEPYADSGYELARASDQQSMPDFNVEYDALQMLLFTKLELGKLAEVEKLLQRLDKVFQVVGNDGINYFNNIGYFETKSRFYEMKGDYAAAVRYANLAKPLQDSLDRRNDARKFEKIQQRLEAEKYTEKLRLVESEKQLQKLLRNATLIILLLVAALAYGNYHRLQYKRRQAMKELEAAKSNLESFTQRFREKSDLAENLRLEIERLSKSGERSEYLEKLTHSTILTDEDWTQFRSIFEKVHPDFIAKQKALHPDLTQAELRYLVLEKLQLNTHEMANMLGVSDGTIRQTRMRMKRKTGT